MTTVNNRRSLNISKDNSNERLTVLMLASISLSVAGLLIGLLTAINSVRIANKPAPSLVQLNDGTAIATKAENSLHREPETIKNFVRRIQTATYTWDGYLPAETPEDVKNPQADPGVEIEIGTDKKATIATSTYESMSAYDPMFANEFMQKLAQSFPETVFSEGKQVFIVIKFISEPIPIKGRKHEWTVNMVANLVVFGQNGQLGEAIPLNKEIYVRAVEPPKYEDSQMLLTKIVTKYRQAGLEIFDIREFTIDNLHAK